MNDLEYLKQGLFTSFFPNTKEGEQVWREIVAQSEGTGKIFTMHLPAVLSQLRKAGFKVAKSKKATKADFQAIFKEIEALGI